MFVAPLEQASAFPHEPRRSRKLLLHAREIAGHPRGPGARADATAVPMRLYFKQGRVKVEIGVGKGKKQYDKRHDIAKRDADREARQDARPRGRDERALRWAPGGEARVVSMDAGDNRPALDRAVAAGFAHRGDPRAASRPPACA